MQQNRKHKNSKTSFLNQLRVPYLAKHFGVRPTRVAFVFINSFFTMAILSLLALVSGTSLIFPSLGPTAMLFFLSPLAEASKPKNALLGHAIGIICGYLALVATGLTSAPSVMSSSVTLPRVLAASLALAFTGAFMVITNVSHPPAGATTLIVALGFITKPSSLIVIEVAVALLAIQAIVINKLANNRDKGS